MAVRNKWLVVGVVSVVVAAFGGPAAGQLASKPPVEWMANMERPDRVAGLKIDYIIEKLGLKPGEVVADIGAGPGVLSLPMAKAVAPGGTVYAVDIDQAFIDHIQMRAKEQNVTNVKAVLGKLTDPNLPARDVDIAVFHDVLHHIENRAAYLKAMAQYLKPKGRIAIVELPANGSHKDDPTLVVTKEQVKGWMADAGLAPVEEIDGLPQGKWCVVYGR